MTFEELAEDFLTDYKVNARKSLGDAQRRVRKHLARFFGGGKAQEIIATDVQAYILRRQEEGEGRQGRST